jgi:hypothetical protein
VFIHKYSRLAIARHAMMWPVSVASDEAAFKHATDVSFMFYCSSPQGHV